MRRWIAFIPLFLLLGVSNVVSAEVSKLPEIPLTIANHELQAEVAHTQKTRTQGLMFRSSLGENTGMLFVFPHTAYFGMWMKNTMIPLSVAFINEAGIILNIEDMKPYSLTAHQSAGRAKYALEMNQGWFEDRKITTGAQVIGLEHAPAAE
ncbi:MAG: DUF192 domain-containing protein [Nitrosomonas sp.]|nr:DUF192 domain-containing protein [Nitrosomonas sp.]